MFSKWSAADLMYGGKVQRNNCVSLSLIPMVNGRFGLDVWQAIYFLDN